MDILFFAVLALFIFFMLSKQFGKISEDEKNDIYRKLEERKRQIENILAQNQMKTKNNQSPQNSTQQPTEKLVGASSSLTDSELKNLDSATAENLNKIFSACNIDLTFFTNGAKGALEMTLNAFAKEDLQTLRNLLAKQIYENFESAINQRKQAGKVLITNLIAIEKFEIISAMLLENQASITAKFVSRQINYFSDENGNLLEGRKDEINEIIDIWTFKKDISSPDPNWIITSTAS